MEATNTTEQINGQDPATGAAEEVEEQIPLIALTIVTPTKDELKLSVTKNELIYEIRQYLLGDQHTCIYTHYHFEHKGVALKEEQSSELIQLVPEAEHDLVLTMVENVYTDFDSREHVRRVRELLSPVQKQDGRSVIADLSRAEVADHGVKTETTEVLHDTAQLSSFFLKAPEPIKVVKALNYSGFNPAPPARRLAGDFFYLDVALMEGEPIVVVANARGFYVSQSKQGKFNAAPLAKPAQAKTLVGCLSQYSAKFKKAFEDMQAHQEAQRASEPEAVPFPPASWLGRAPKSHEFDLGRAEQDMASVAETVMLNTVQGRDWNEEMQTARQLPHKTTTEAITRDQALYRLHAEYVEAATHGALAIFNGQVQALNPSDEPKNWIFLHNNIFYTQAVDMRGTFADCGGDETFLKTLNNDLIAIKRFHEADPEDLFTLDNVLIKYAGRAIFAQTLLPGLFNGLVSGESSIVYGSLEDGTITANAEFHTRLAKVAAHLHLKEHKVISKKKDDAESAASPVSLYTSSEVKGIVGTDHRHYLIDFGHLLPRDANYSTDKTPNAVYRPELLSAYLTRQWYLQVARAKANRQAKIQQIAKQKKEAEDKGEKFEIPELAPEPEEPFPRLTLNADLFVKDVKLADSEEEINAEKQLSATLGKFLTTECLTSIVTSWASGSEPIPVDSQTLVQTLHAHGINLRYLGLLASNTAQVAPSASDVLMREMIMRAAKSAFNTLVQKVDAASLGDFVVAFLNAFFNKLSTVGKGFRSGLKPAHLADDAKHQPHNDEFGLSHASLWASIRKLVEEKFKYQLPDLIPAAMFELATLRSLCLRLGVKLEAKNYDFNKDKPIDISNLIELVPVVKHVAPVSRDAAQLLALSKQKLADTEDPVLEELLTEALSVTQQVYGFAHRDTSTLLSLLAVHYFHNQEVDLAIQHQERAALVSEIVNGADHAETVQAFITLGHMIASTGNLPIALNYMRRALYLTVLAAGWNHFENIGSYLNIVGLLQENKQYKESLPMLAKSQLIAEQLITKDLEGGIDLIVNGLVYSTLANIAHFGAVANAGLNQFRDALSLEKKNYTILKQMQVPEDDPRLVESNAWLHELTRKAVEVEKTNKAQHAEQLGSRLGTKKGVNTKLLKKAGLGQGVTPVDVLGQQAALSAAASIKRPAKGPSPKSVIGKGAAQPAQATSSAQAASTSAPAGKKVKKTGNNSSAPVPDLL